MQGKWVKGYTKRLGWCDASKAELWSIVLGLELAWTDGYHNVIVESDSQSIVSQLNKISSEINNALGKRIRSFQARPWNLHFQYVSRVNNRCAHYMATHALSSNTYELRVLFSPWPDLADLLSYDARGATHAPNP